MTKMWQEEVEAKEKVVQELEAVKAELQGLQDGGADDEENGPTKKRTRVE
jgi:hypothetical protein